MIGVSPIISPVLRTRTACSTPGLARKAGEELPPSFQLNLNALSCLDNSPAPALATVEAALGICPNGMSTGNKLKEWFSGRKDSSVSFVLERVLQSQLERYGRVVSFQMSSQRSSARLELLLKGEVEAMTINLERYTIESDEGGAWLAIQEASASREWMTLALKDFVVGKRLPIPEKYLGVAKMLL